MLSTSVTIPIQLTFEQLVTQLSQEQLWSLQELIRQQLPPPPSQLSILEDSGLVGCGEAEEDLSENYKMALTESWSAKHDYR
jgi:hypothetical protein